MTNEDSRQIAAKIARFNNVNSEIIERMLTKFVHNIALLLPFNILKVDLRSANPFSNARATSKGRSWHHLRTSSKFNWLPWYHPLGEHQMNIGIIIPTDTPTKPVK